MGKGTIKAEDGAGRYSVTLAFDTERVAGRILKLRARLAELANLLDQAELDYSTAMATYIEKQDSATLAAYLGAKNAVNRLAVMKLGVEKTIERLEGMPGAEDVDGVCCADLTTELSGTFGIIKVPDERGHVQIQPGRDANTVYDPARDEQLQTAAAGTPANVFRNWALLPGWQKWKPTYRYGVITALDEEADACAVLLDDARSSQQGLGINQTAELTDVPVSYMECNAAAFEVGDHVLVKFNGQEWGRPVVIGFYDNPKPCSRALRVKIKSAAPQQYFRIRLFHPDYGYGWCDAVTPDPGTPGSYIVEGDSQVPGGMAEIGNCYVEIERRNWHDAECEDSRARSWFTQYYAPAILEASAIGDVTSAANLGVTDFFSVALPAEASAVLEPLGELDRKHVWIYNAGSEPFEINDCGIWQGRTAHFYWTGTEWNAPAEYAESSNGPTFRGCEILQLSGRDYLRFANASTGAWYAPVTWMRSTRKISQMASEAGVAVAKFDIWSVSFFGNSTYFLDKDVLCACEGTIAPSDPVSIHNADPGSSDQFPGSSIQYASGTGSTGACTPDIGYLFSGHIIFLASTTAVAGSAVLLSDMFGTIEPAFTDFEYWLSAYSSVEGNSVFDEWWAGDTTYCAFGSSLNFAFGEYTKELLPEGEF